MAIPLAGPTGFCTSTSIAQLVYKWNNPKNNRRLIRLKLKLSIQHPDTRNIHSTLIPAHISFWFSGMYLIISSQVFIALSRWFCYTMFLLSFTNSVLLSTNYSIKTLELAKKKKATNINLYVLGSPLTFFQKAVL